MSTRRLAMQLHLQLRKVRILRSLPAVTPLSRVLTPAASLISRSGFDTRMAKAFSLMPTASVRTFATDTEAPDKAINSRIFGKDFLQQLSQNDAELTAAIKELNDQVNANNKLILDKATSLEDRDYLKSINQRLIEERKTVTEAMKNISEKMWGSPTWSPLSAPSSRLFSVQDQYQELVRLASVSLSSQNIPRLELNKEAQDKYLGDFSKEDAVVPFLVINGKGEPDLRFSTAMTGGKFVPEAEQIVKLSGLLHLLATSASGKTRSLFDAARQAYMIYVSCILGNSSDAQKNLVDEYRAAEKVFPAMVDQILGRCRQIRDPTAKETEGYRLVAADVCSRVVFLNWLLETFKDQPELCTPEQFLLLQLAGGQEQMLKLFRQLVKEPVDVIEEICEHARTQLAARGVKPIFAIDDAQVAADTFSDLAKESCVFTLMENRNVPRSLLYAYTRKADQLLARPPIVIAGTGFTRHTAHRVPADLGKATAEPQPLPVLLQEDVAQRLKRLLNMTDDELKQVKNLACLVGRPRWTAAVVRRLAEGTLAGELANQSKHAVLQRYIDTVTGDAIKYTSEKLSGSLSKFKTHGGDNDLRRLLRKMFVIFSVFKRGDQAIQMFFTDAEAQAMLRFGLGQVIDPLSTSSTVPVALDDYVTRHAVISYAAKQSWSVGKILLRNFEDYFNSTKPSANGISFETVVAGAIASYTGSVKDFLESAANHAGEPVPALPDWTKFARLGAVAFEELEGDDIDDKLADSLSDLQSHAAINKIHELMESNRAGLIRPPVVMRPDLFGPQGLGSDFEFSVVVSTKLLKVAMKGMDIVDDMASTNPTEFFKAKPSTRVTSTSTSTAGGATTDELTGEGAVVARWNKTWNMLKSRFDGRVLRIHVAFRKGFSKDLKDTTADKLREHGELAKGSSMLSAVHVKGTEVRVIIDANNYKALFVDPELRESIAKLLKSTPVTTTRSSRSRRQQ